MAAIHVYTHIHIYIHTLTHTHLPRVCTHGAAGNVGTTYRCQVHLSFLLQRALVRAVELLAWTCGLVYMCMHMYVCVSRARGLIRALGFSCGLLVVVSGSDIILKFWVRC